MEDGEALALTKPKFSIVIKLRRGLQKPTQKATTAQGMFSQETNEEHPEVAAAEAAAEPDASTFDSEKE